MKGSCFLFILALLVAAESASAGIIFNRKPKPKPEAVGTATKLISILKSDPNEHRRAAAARDLRQFESNGSPELVAALAESAQRDPQPGVRMEALSTLTKLRPVSQQAGKALEQAVDNDPSTRVRLQARTLLIQYRLSGYRSGGDSAQPPPDTEPPLAPEFDPNFNPPPSVRLKPTLVPSMPITSPYPTVPAAPVQPPKPAPIPAPLPQGPNNPPMKTTMEPPLLDPVPATPTSPGPETKPPQ